jgi:hypothetical protein
MNKRDRQKPHNPYRTPWDAIFDIRQPALEEEEIAELTVAQNKTATMLIEFQQRYNLLSAQEKQRVDGYITDIYEILGFDPGMRFESGESFAGLMQLLLADVADHTVRIGRIERLLEQLFSTHPPTPFADDPQKIGESEHENRNRIVSAHNRNTVTRNRKPVTVTQEMCVIICANYRKVSNAEIADACGCSLSTIEKAIYQLKQEGQLS